MITTLPAQDITKEKLLKIVRQKSSLIKTLGFDYTVFGLPYKNYDDDLTTNGLTKHFIHKYKGEKSYVSELNDKGKVIHIMSYDGEKSYLLTPKRYEDSLTIQTGMANEIISLYSPKSFFDCIECCAPIEEILQRENTIVRKDNDKILIEWDDHYIFQKRGLVVRKDHYIASGKVWIDPKLNYAIVKMDDYVNKIPASKSEISEFKLMKVDGCDIHFPMKIITKRYDFFKDGRHIYSNEYNVLKVDINKNYPDRIFKQTGGLFVKKWDRSTNTGVMGKK